MRESQPFTHVSTTNVSARTIVVASALLLIVACGERTEQQAALEDVSGADERWALVQAYLTLDRAWHDGEFRRMGPRPDITLAVAAAREIVAQADHPRRMAAAEFLVLGPHGLSETAAEDMALGAQTLRAVIGPDWSVVEAYKADAARWQMARQAIDAADIADDERQSRRKALGSRPTAHRAVAAAQAIVAVADHARRRDAAVYLVLELDRGAHVLEGARLLFADFPAFDRWPEAMRAVDRSYFRANEEVDQFYAQVAAGAADATVRATARYFQAARLAQAANGFSLAPAEREAKRERALELAVGLSEGVADREFVKPREYADDGTPVVGTFAQAEADLVHRIRHVTAGGTLADATGKRFDGTEETLAAYAGKVVLIDFWATWCAPCIAALPKLRKLHAELPPDRFTMLAINADADLETVVDFQKDEPMPWSNWHVGDKSKLGIAWGVRAYPTYILVDEQGVVLARTNGISDAFLALVEDAVHGRTPAMARDATEASDSAPS